MNVETAYGYTNESYGDSTELLYLRSRYYASGTGRFLTRDTWSGDANSPMSFNRWNYVDGNPANRTDPFGLFPLETITNNIPITDFAIDNSSVVSPVGRSRWGFLAALRKAEDYDYLRVGALDLTSLYPKLAVSRTEMIWSINCDVIMVGGRTLSTYFENEVKRQRMPYIYWRDTSARYYDLFNSLKPSQSFVDGGFVNDYPPYRSISLGYFAEINIIADINGQLHASLSAGPGGTFGWAYTEGYLCPIQMEGCGDMPPISEVTDALNGFCFPEGNIQLLGGIAVALCEALTDNRQDPMAFTGIVTYYAGLQVGLGGGGTVTVSLPYQNPMLGWGWAVNDQLNGWNISSAWLNYR